ncbi:hypothetical protein ACP70R_009978 [Stipagrostis hirtigluma subsp. patula]
MDAAADGHDQPLDDLLETRDRIEARLDEGELAVADKDRDYMRRKREDLGRPSRRETASPAERSGACRRDDVEEGGALGELKGSVDREMSRMKARLEDARSALAGLTQKVSGEASPMARLQEASHEGDGVKGLSGFSGMAQMLMEFQEMVLDAGAVKDSVASSFDVMERSVSALSAAMDEQQWLMDAEREMHSAVVEGFLREINVESKCTSSPGDGCHPPTLHHDSDATEKSQEREFLKDETRQLQSTRHIPEEKTDRRQRCHSEERGISREEAEMLTEEKVDSEIRCELQDVLYAAICRDLVWKLTAQGEAQKLIEEKDEVGIRSKLQCELHTTVFRDVQKKLAADSAELFVETFITDEVNTIFVAMALNECWSTTEEWFIKEDIDRIVFGGLAEDLINYVNLIVLKSNDESRRSNNLGRSSMADNVKQLRKAKLQTNITTEDEVVDSDQVLVGQEISGITGDCVRQNSKESDLQAETPTDRDGVCDSVSGNCNAEEALEDHRKLPTGEVAISLRMPSEGIDQEMFIPSTNFQELLTDFESATCRKIGTAVLRLSDMDKQLDNLAEQVSSLKRSEFIYQSAFTRRCCDLQTAEAEVDLLGDDVELLLEILRKTYKALNHYSPVLQHYLGIREMLILLGKELAVRRQVQ